MGPSPHPLVQHCDCARADVHLRDALARRQQPPAAPPAVAPPPVGADDTDAAPDRALSPVLIGSSSSLEDLSTLAFASSANRAAGLNFARAKTWPEYDKKAHRATDAPLAPIDSQEDVSTDDEALPLAKADTVVRDMEMDEGKDEAEPRKQDAAQVDEEEEEDVVEVVLEKAVLSPTRPVSPWIPVKRAVPAPSPPPPPPTPPTRPKSSLSLKRARAATPSSHTPASHTLLDQWCKKKT